MAILLGVTGPTTPAGNPIVLGSASDTVYMGGAGGATPTGITVTQTALSICGNTSLIIGGGAGSLGQAFSASGGSCYWGPSGPVTGQTTMVAPYSGLYVLTTGGLQLSSGYTGQTIRIKNATATTQTLTGAIIPAGQLAPGLRSRWLVALPLH